MNRDIDNWLNKDLDYLDELNNRSDNKIKDHINYLFNRLIKYCKDNNLRDGDGNYLIDKRMIDSFIKFVYDNS